MVIKESNKNKETAQILDTVNFSIQASSKSFSILSKNLYKNNIRAIIRELYANAWDAQKEADCYNDIEVKLPTVSEENSLEFSIKDFGVGMTKEELLTVFSTYFNSTKNETNELIGGLGLGSKSPFSYTDEFFVESSKNGEYTIVKAFMTEEGLPSLSVLHSSKNLETGTRIYFQVKEDDIKAFHREAALVFLSFDKLPEIVQGKNYFLGEVRDILGFSGDNENTIGYYNQVKIDLNTNSDFHYRTALSYSDSIDTRLERLFGSKILLKMGNVLYEVDSATALEDEFYNSLIKVMQNVGTSDEKRSLIVLHAGIGDVDISPSRETLNYSTRTKDFLKKLLIEKIKNKVEKFESIKLSEMFHKVEHDTKFKEYLQVLSKKNFSLGYIKSNYKECISGLLESYKVLNLEVPVNLSRVLNIHYTTSQNPSCNLSLATRIMKYKEDYDVIGIDSFSKLIDTLGKSRRIIVSDDSYARMFDYSKLNRNGMDRRESTLKFYRAGFENIDENKQSLLLVNRALEGFITEFFTNEKSDILDLSKKTFKRTPREKVEKTSIMKTPVRLLKEDHYSVSEAVLEDVDVSKVAYFIHDKGQFLVNNEEELNANNNSRIREDFWRQVIDLNEKINFGLSETQFIVIEYKDFRKNKLSSLGMKSGFDVLAQKILKSKKVISEFLSQATCEDSNYFCDDAEKFFKKYENPKQSNFYRIYRDSLVLNTSSYVDSVKRRLHIVLDMCEKHARHNRLDNSKIEKYVEVLRNKQIAKSQTVEKFYPFMEYFRGYNDISYRVLYSTIAQLDGLKLKG